VFEVDWKGSWPGEPSTTWQLSTAIILLFQGPKFSWKITTGQIFHAALSIVLNDSKPFS